MPLHIRNIPADADELDVLYYDPLPVLVIKNELIPTASGPKFLGYQLLKRVTVANLETLAGGITVIPLAKGEDRPGRFFDCAAAKTVNDIRYVGPRGGFDYHNQAPYTAGKVRDTFTVGQKSARIPLAPHLFDPDARGATMAIIPAGQTFGRQNLPAWAALQGTDLVVDSSSARAETTVAVKLTDEKGLSAVLDVTFEVVTPAAPVAPGAVQYVAVGELIGPVVG